MNFTNLNRKFGILTIFSVFLLLLAGGIVRSTGSGMGCPDWPKCYDRYIPPTKLNQLPTDYKEIQLAKRLKKAQKFANLLTKMGYEKQAQAILNDPELYIPEEFNTRKAWTEYLNRLVGVLSGIFALGFMLTLIKARFKTNKTKFWFGVLGFIMMLFNGWLGSIVVATNLFPFLVTIHYLAAYAALAFFIISISNSTINGQNFGLSKFKWFYVFLLLLSLVQIYYGTQLRQVTDYSIKTGALYANNTLNLTALGSIFSIHRILAIILILFCIVPLFSLKGKLDKKWTLVLLAIPTTFILQYITGLVNLQLKFPVIAQVGHVFLAGVVFGLSLYICTAIFSTTKK